MLHVDYLRIHLPAAMRPQASDFADYLAQALSRIQLSQRARIESIRVDPVEVDACQGANATAQAVAAQIQRAIEGGGHGR